MRIIYILNSTNVLNADLQGIKVQIVAESEQGLSLEPVDKNLKQKYGVLNRYFDYADLKECD